MTISTFEQLKTFVDSISSERYYFRGYKNIDELKPTLGRRQNSNRNECAQNAFCQFVKKLYTEGFHEQTLKDWISIAQHYGIPTKLVDLTSDPWVAVYFGLGREHRNGQFTILGSLASNINRIFEGKLKTYGVKLGDLFDLSIGQTCSLTLEQMFELREDSVLSPGYMESAILERIYNSFFDIQDEFNLLMYDKTINLRIDRQKGLFVLFKDENKSLDLDWFEKITVNLSDEEVLKVWTYLKGNGYTPNNLLPESIDGISVATIANEITRNCFPSI